MSYAVVYESRTGNTARVAEAIRAALPQPACLYFGPPDPAALAADTLFVGSWTDKGTCAGATGAFLARCGGKRVALFGTAGFGGDPDYFSAILFLMAQAIPEDAEYLGGWMCQGRMPQSVLDRYTAMPEGPQRDAMLENFDKAITHPDEKDLTEAGRWAGRVL